MRRHPRILLSLACAAVPAIVACSRPPPAPAPAPGVPLSPPEDEWTGGRVAFLAVADTEVSITRPDGVVTLHDRRTLRRVASGDFEVEVVRTHRGSEAGDTEESFRAVRSGTGFFTRGSGGPFIRWEDARDEPRAAAADVLQGSRDLVALAGKCGRVGGDEAVRTWSLAGPDCTVGSSPSQAGFTATVRALEGELRSVAGRPTQLRLRVGMRMQSEGREAEVIAEHSLTVSDLPATEVVAEPADAVPARRERPVLMARSVLGGLVDAWGQGAPERFRKPAKPDR